MVWLLVLILGLIAMPVQATTYYVNDALGNDSNAGTSGGASAWKTIQKACNSGTPVVAGDTVLVQSGTYTVASGNYTVRCSSGTGASSGTISNPITIQSETNRGALVRAPATTALNVAFEIALPYYIIQGFEIDGGTLSGNQSSTSLSYAGIAFRAGATGGVARNNWIHNIGWDLCSNSVFGFSAIFIAGADGNLIEDNLFDTIGRLYNAETGTGGVCSTTLFQNDHGVYIETGNNTTVRHNVFSNISRGFPVNLYKSGQASTYVHTNVHIDNNTFDNPAGETRGPCGQIIYGQSQTGLRIANNIFSRPETSAFQTFNVGTMTSVSFVTNRMDVNDANFHCGSVPSGVTVGGDNLANVTFNFTNISSKDYTLTASSTTALNTGTDLGEPFNGSAPEIGAFEVPVFSSCEVPSGAGSKIRMTFENNLFPPISPASGATTITARKNAASNALTGSVTRISDNILELTLTNTYAGGDTADISWSSGNITDFAQIGGALNQKYIQVLTNQSCPNNVGGVGYTLTQASCELHEAEGSEASPTILPYGFGSSGAAENYQNFPVVQGGRLRVRCSIVCSGGTCPSTAFSPYVSYNGGGYALVPDAFGSDNIAMCGVRAGNPANGSATTSQLTTPGTHRPGGIVYTSSAIPTVNGLTDGDKTEMEYCVKFDVDAANAYDFQIRTQGGAVLGGGYTFTPHLVIMPPMSGGVGF